MIAYSKDFCICNDCELERAGKRMGYFGGESLRAGCHIKLKDELNPPCLKITENLQVDQNGLACCVILRDAESRKNGKMFISVEAFGQ